MNVSVPLSLLEDIFGLLDYLDEMGNRDDAHFRKTRNSSRLKHDAALWELKFMIKRLRCQCVDAYLMTVEDVTDEEVSDLEQWVADGHSVYDNPHLICDESGRTMDFINACRVELDMLRNPSDYFPDVPTGGACAHWNDDDLPF